MLALLAALQLQLQVTATAPDSAPTVTLSEALRRATGLDPNYVAAVGQGDNALWARRSAFAVFIIPSVSLTADATRYSSPTFNVGALTLQTNAVDEIGRASCRERG